MKALTKEQQELIDWIKTTIEYAPNELNQAGFYFNVFHLGYDFRAGIWRLYMELPYFHYDTDICNFIHKRLKLLINFDIRIIYDRPDEFILFVNRAIEMYSNKIYIEEN
mgnify:CR=1 FL=1